MVTYESTSAIGLHIAKMHIEAYGGRIRADDRVLRIPVRERQYGSR